MLEARELTRDYRVPSGVVRALRGVSLRLARGEFLAVTGPSGCGKSTLLHLLGLVDTPTSGEVRMDGRVASALGESERAAIRLRRVGFVFQRFYLLPMLTAEENVWLPMLEAGVPAPERDRRARELLRYVGLEDRLRHKPAQLSGGEMQRVAIARALANRPEVVLGDEPTGELDAANNEQVGRLLRQLAHDGTAVVVATHNPELAGLADRVLKLRDGREAR
ncbi:MAG TPA: ABC transporter ATP-binding protein [Candidatus Saccharimonadales bacterium]|nr:ABC transporter ATP-binding protein [Candidatus Saccharimonadales bacterium]